MIFLHQQAFSAAQRTGAVAIAPTELSSPLRTALIQRSGVEGPTVPLPLSMQSDSTVSFGCQADANTLKDLSILADRAGLDRPTAAWQSGAAEVTSQNFKVQTSSGYFLAKRCGEEFLRSSYVAAVNRVLKYLEDSGVRTIPFIEDGSGNELFDIQGQKWLAMPFIKADRLYNGSMSDLSLAASEIGLLHHSLQRF